VGYRQLSRRSEPWTLFSCDVSRIPSIMEERATAYSALFFRSTAAAKVVAQNKKEIEDFLAARPTP
jgi:hypothetical protein